MPIASTRSNIKSLQTSSRSDNNNKVFCNKRNNYIHEQVTKKAVVTSQNIPLKKFEHGNKQQISRNHPTMYNKYNNISYTKIRYDEDNSTCTPVLSPNSTNSTSTDSDVSNAWRKISATNKTFWNKGCVDLHNHVESSDFYRCQSVGQIELSRYPSNTSDSSISAQSSCTDSDQEFCNPHNNGDQRANYISSTTEENVKRVIPQYWITSLYDIYSVTQKFSPLENMHQNYLDTVRYTILAIWDTSYDSKFHYWMQQVLQKSGTNCRIIELALYYLLRFKRCLSRSKVELSCIFNYSRFTISTEPCPKSQESIKPLPALISSLIIAWKFFQDENYKTNHWKSFTGYTIEQLNVFERDFLRMIDYNVFIKENSFKQWLRFLHSHMQAICGPGLDVKFAYSLPQNRDRINEFIKSLKMLNIEEMERIIRINERRGKEVLNFEAL
ncbi:hypothetical protein C1645_756559 [Glomus cerebriforme]|uniref:Cyclin-domain-containing protein n=1 Tax=Glomus cerebriforme TaxID=658196 RepID=A0A397TLY4_9GLOM|nr:hypothetical protein C1645_756559 [Glomus cerebriforme]